jgi:hypothetical protein
MLRLYAGLRARAEERLKPGMAEGANHRRYCIAMLYGMQRGRRPSAQNLRGHLFRVLERDSRHEPRFAVRSSPANASSIRAATHDALHHIHWVRVQHFAPLDHFRHVESPVTHLDPADVAVSTLQAPRQFSLCDTPPAPRPTVVGFRCIPESSTYVRERGTDADSSTLSSCSLLINSGAERDCRRKSLFTCQSINRRATETGQLLNIRKTQEFEWRLGYDGGIAAGCGNALSLPGRYCRRWPRDCARSVFCNFWEFWGLRGNAV